MAVLDRRTFLQGTAASALVLGTTTQAIPRELAPTEPLAVAAIARGRSGERLASQLARTADLELCRVAGVKIRPTGKASNARGQNRWRVEASSIVRDNSIRALLVSVPGPLPVRLAMRAVQCGQHVYLDALRGYAADELAELAHQAQATGCMIQVGMPHRAAPALQAAVAFVRQGGIGTVHSATAICVRQPGEVAAPLGSAGWSARTVQSADLALWLLGTSPTGPLETLGADTQRHRAAALPELFVARREEAGRTLTLLQRATAGPAVNGVFCGAIIEGAHGRIVAKLHSATASDLTGKVLRQFDGGSGDLLGNFLEAARSRQPGLLLAPLAATMPALLLVQEAASAHGAADETLTPSPLAATLRELAADHPLHDLRGNTL